VFKYVGGALITFYDLDPPPDRPITTWNITETYTDRLRSTRPAPPPRIVLGQ
jgi:hypothetical protein